MIISEGLVDKRIEQATKYDKTSDTYLKYEALAVSNIVGNYSAATAQIAKARGRSVSTIENHAHAHWMKLELQKINPRHARQLWHILTVSHFWRAWEGIHQLGYDAMPYMLNAALHGWSGKGMLAEFDKERTAGNAPIQRARAVHSLRGLALELMKYDDLTDGQAAALDAVVKEFEA